MPHTFNTSLKNVAANYLQLLKAKVTEKSIKQEIEENPYYPSLLSLSETFSKYKIDNNAFHVERESFGDLVPPFVAFVNMPDTGKDFVLVTNISDNSIKFLYKTRKEKIFDIEEFVGRYQGIVWFAQPDTNSGEKSYEQKQQQIKKKNLARVIRYFLVGLLVIFAFGSNITLENYLTFLPVALLKIIGTATTIMLMVYEYDANNTFISNICSADGHRNCDAVLRSKAAKIGSVSWAEIGFFYFSSTTLWLLLSTPLINLNIKVELLSLANLFAAPYILFSIYYQWKIVKQWCPLCLTVQATLFFELIWAIVNFWAHPFVVLRGLGAREGLMILSCILLPILIWYAIKPILSKSVIAETFSLAYKRLQYNPEIFETLLKQQPKAPDGWQHLGISLGNQNASNTIIKVCNPYCTPCAQMHPVLEEIVDNNSDVQLRILFTGGDKAAPIIKHLLAFSRLGNLEKTKQALNEWYSTESKDYASFSSKYPVNENLTPLDNELYSMAKWCSEAEIKFTPTLFVNEYRIPDNYNAEELKNIL